MVGGYLVICFSMHFDIDGVIYCRLNAAEFYGQIYMTELLLLCHSVSSFSFDIRLLTRVPLFGSRDVAVRDPWERQIYVK